MTTTPTDSPAPAPSAAPSVPAGLAGEHAAALARLTAFAREYEARNANGTRNRTAPLLATGAVELRLEDLMLVAGIDPRPTCSCCRRLLSDPAHRTPNCATCATQPAG